MRVAFVLEGHLPYLRHNGPRPDGEDALHHLIACCLLPVLRMLSDLQQSGLRPQISLAFSPLLLDQLNDPVVQKHFVIWIDQRIEQCARDLQRFSAADAQHEAYLARFELDWLRQTRHLFVERFARQPVAALRDLVNHDVITPLASPATHAVLPLLRRPASRRAQIEQGLLAVTSLLGRPAGCWLPAGAWAPGLTEILTDVDLRYVLVDAHCCPSDHLPGWLLPRRLAALPIDDRLAEHIWSPELGYRGDPLYRNTVDGDGYCALGQHGRAPYDPYHALRRAQEHAAHFVEQLVQQAADNATGTRIIPLHTDLIGGSWFEGTTWLQSVLTLCATHPALQLSTPDQELGSLRSDQRVDLQVSGWNHDGLAAWQRAGYAGYWAALARAEAQLTALAALPHGDNPAAERLLNQAARELLLAQSRSAVEQPEGAAAEAHLSACERLCRLVERGSALHEDEDADVAELEAHHAPFADLNYRIFH